MQRLTRWIVTAAKAKVEQISATHTDLKNKLADYADDYQQLNAREKRLDRRRVAAESKSGEPGVVAQRTGELLLSVSATLASEVDCQ